MCQLELFPRSLNACVTKRIIIQCNYKESSVSKKGRLRTIKRNRNFSNFETFCGPIRRLSSLLPRANSLSISCVEEEDEASFNRHLHHGVQPEESVLRQAHFGPLPFLQVRGTEICSIITHYTSLLLAKTYI